jgi:hypothetical protein
MSDRLVRLQLSKVISNVHSAKTGINHLAFRKVIFRIINSISELSSTISNRCTICLHRRYLIANCTGLCTVIALQAFVYGQLYCCPGVVFLVGLYRRHFAPGR